MSATDAIGYERTEALLRGDAPRTPAEERRSAVLGSLRSTTLRAPDGLRARVLAPRPEARGLALPRLPRRLSLVVVPAALALAVAAALVHGLARPTRNAVAPPAVATLGAKAPPAAAESMQAAPTPDRAARLAHTDASLTVRVADKAQLEAATEKAARVASALGGYAQSVVSRNPAVGGSSSYLELRIPTPNVKTALTQLAALGTLVSQQVSTKDLEHDLAVESEQIAQLRRRVAALQEALRSQALPEAQRVLLQIRLAEAKRALAQRLAARKGTIAAATTSRVSLVLEAADAASAPPVHRGRLGRVLHSAVGFLALEGVVALYVLIVAAPFALAAGLWWALVRLRRRRDENRLLLA